MTISTPDQSQVSPSQAGQIQVLQEQLTVMQQQLMQAQKMSSVGALASSITHEFNNILTTVINYAKLGLRNPDDATREKAFTRILSAGERASKLTTGILSYARTGTNKLETVNLAELCRDILVLVEKDLSIHRVNLATEFHAEPLVRINSTQIQHVILNLTINARQAMETGGQITLIVNSNPESGMGEISVRDTGCGIAPERLPHIFEPFFSTKEADSSGCGGTGLGLALCKEIIQAHRGRIRVESTIGKGTTFTLRLPLAEAKPIEVPVPVKKPA